jgi:hypothetical protein
VGEDFGEVDGGRDGGGSGCGGEVEEEGEVVEEEGGEEQGEVGEPVFGLGGEHAVQGAGDSAWVSWGVGSSLE